MPTSALPFTTRFGPSASFQARISLSFCRSRRCAGRALAGIITRPAMSRWKPGAGGAVAGREGVRTIVFEWQTRVVTRSSTGIRQRSDSSMASSVKS